MIRLGSDLSRGSDAAVRLAVAWARRSGDGLRAVHAVPAGRAADLVALRAELAEQLRRCGGAAAAAGGAETAVVEADPLDPLRPAPGHVVVVGSEGGSATLLRQVGHVALSLAAGEAPGPVLIAPLGWVEALPGRRRSGDAARGRAGRTLGERVLVGCSLRDAAADARRVARAGELLAPGSTTAELHLAHVVDASAARHHPSSLRRTSRDDAAARAADEALRELAADAVPIDRAAWREPRRHVVVQGPPDRDLAGLAESQAIDLLVLGPGPVAPRCLALARCPVLIAGGP